MNGVGDMVFSGKKNLVNVSVCKIKSATHCQTQGPSWELELTDVQTWPLSLTTAQETGWRNMDSRQRNRFRLWMWNL